MHNTMIDAVGLTKSYGTVKAVRGIDFYVETGSLFALLGENGAGKSTTIDMLTTLLAPDAGEVHINGCLLGRQNEAIRRSIGTVFQQSVLDGKLTVRENLMVRAGFYGMGSVRAKSRINEIAQPLGIDEFLDRRYEKLSGGQRRRADIARALLHTPAMLFLDEPTTGLDPASRKAIWEMVRRLQRAGDTTVLLTTHYMEEAAAADYVVVLGHGQVLAKGTPPQLKTTYSRDSLRFEAKDLPAMEAHLAKDGVDFAKKGALLQVKLNSTLEAVPLLQRYAKEFRSFEVAQGSMDDAFLNIIGSDREGAGLQ